MIDQGQDCGICFAQPAGMDEHVNGSFRNKGVGK
jgi:hypothetical protein